MKIELTDQEAQELLQLADAAVRAHGLKLARQAVRVMDILDAAANPAPEDQ